MSSDVDINEIRENIANHVDWALDRKVPLAEIRSIFRDIKRSLSARNGEGLKNKLNSEFDSKKLAKLESELGKLLKSHVMFDDKLISVYYEMDASKISKKLSSFLVQVLIQIMKMNLNTGLLKK